MNAVTWISDPYPLGSEADVLAAEAAGHLSIDRVEEMDFVCPVAGNGHGRR